MSKRHQNPQNQTICYAATCQSRRLSRSTNRLHSYTVTRAPADASSYRVRCPSGNKVNKFKHFVQATCQCKQLSRSTSKLQFTSSDGHLWTQAAIALEVTEAPKSTNAYILLGGHLQVQTTITFDQQLSFLHRHAATCGRRRLSR